MGRHQRRTGLSSQRAGSLAGKLMVISQVPRTAGEKTEGLQGFRSCLCYLLTLWPWVNFLTSLGFSFLVCRLGWGDHHWLVEKINYTAYQNMSSAY